jgi:hypothetical protein
MCSGRAAPCTRRGGSAGRWPATSTATAGIPWDGGVGPVAGDGASPPPGPGPAAGGCAFGRLRSSASQAKRPHPCKLGRALLVCAVLRTRQDPGWASCPTRPRHASGPSRSRPRKLTHPAFDSVPRSVGTAFCAAAGRCRPRSTHCLKNQFLLLIFLLIFPRCAGNRPWPGGWVGWGREPHGCGDRAYMDVLAASPSQLTLPAHPSWLDHTAEGAAPDGRHSPHVR